MAERRLIDLNDVFPNGMMPVITGDPWLTLDKLLKRLDSAPTIDVGERWIPVTERLPEHDNLVLVCTHKGKMLIERYDHTFHHWRGFSSIKVTHWMDLPELPKDGDGNEID